MKVPFVQFVITSAKEVMFDRVYLFVDLLVSNITQKRMTDFDEIFKDFRKWDEEELIKFWE